MSAIACRCRGKTSGDTHARASIRGLQGRLFKTLPFSCAGDDAATLGLPHWRFGRVECKPGNTANAYAIMHILIADDHADMRRGLREILADALPEARFSEVDNGDEVLNRLAHADYSVLLLDINMPGRSGLDVLRDVKRIYPQLPVIMVSVQPPDQYALRCSQAGADAYVNKDNAPEELAQATKNVLDGSRYVGPRLAKSLAGQLG